MTMFKNAAIIGVGQSAYTRHPKEGQTAHTFMRDAAVAALQDAGLSAADVNGMAAALSDDDIHALARYFSQQAPSLWVPKASH